MLKFILKRLAMMIPVLIGVSLVIYAMMYFSPGDAADMMLGDMATAEDKALFREEHHLDEPFLTQYFYYIKGLVLEGDMGTSYATKQPVSDEIFARFPTTLKLALVSTAIAIVVGVLFGIVSAVKQYSIFDNLCTFISMLGVSMPNFWQGMIFIIIFAVSLRWLPPSGLTDWKGWILPAVTLATAPAANIMRMTRSSMLEVIRQDYIRTARAKGESEWSVIMVYALKNALIPIITVVGLQFGRQLGGAVLTESIFSISGLGKLMVDSIKLKNTPVVQGGVLFIAFVMTVLNLLVDILYAYADPRIRSQYVRRKDKKKKTAEARGAAA